MRSTFVKRCAAPSCSLHMACATGMFYTSCPARRCSGICAPLNFVASLLRLSSTLSLRSRGSAQLCRFAPVVPLSFLASRLIAQPTDNPIEKLCSPLDFCWLQKRPFSNGKTYTLLVTSSPGGSLSFYFSRSSPCRAETCFFTSPCSLCHSFNHLQGPAASLNLHNSSFGFWKKKLTRVKHHCVHTDKRKRARKKELM